MEALWVLNAPQNIWFMLLCYGPFSCTRLLLCSADTEMKGSAVHQASFVTSHGHHSPDVPLDARSMEQGSSTIQIQSFQTNTTSFAITGWSLSKARCGESSSTRKNNPNSGLLDQCTQTHRTDVTRAKNASHLLQPRPPVQRSLFAYRSLMYMSHSYYDRGLSRLVKHT